MATINFMIRSKKELAPIYIRFYNSPIDIFHKTNIFVNPKHWDKKRQQIKNSLEVKNRDEINIKLSELKISILTQFNTDYIQGEIIDKNWLSEKVNHFFNRPSGEYNFKIKKEEVYLSHFADWWLENIAPTYKVSASKYMGEKTILYYKRVKDLIKEFEDIELIRLSKINGQILDNFSSFLSKKEFATATIKRHLTRVKFFCERAEQLGLIVNKGYKETVFVKEEDTQYKAPYLSIDEIDKIYNLEINDPDIDAIRDNFIIGLWTGLRVSDFLNRLSLDNINDGYIVIKTLKTKQDVAIPIHPQVRATLNKRFGLLPPKCSDQHFNREIKVICEQAHINNIILGGKIEVKTNEETGEKIKRKEVDYYPKWQLVSSHICRRSFATNHFGKVPNKVIMDVCGWKSEKQMLDYNKQTNIESAKILADYWKKEMNKLEKEAL